MKYLHSLFQDEACKNSSEDDESEELDDDEQEEIEKERRIHQAIIEKEKVC